MRPKDKHRAKLMAYLSDPNNEMPTRDVMASEILGVRRSTFYHHFSPAEISEIETEALEERRKKYAPHLTQVDLALLKKAKEGDPKAAKLAYQRFEGWSEKKRSELTGANGGPILYENMTDEELEAQLKKLTEGESDDG